MLCGKKLEQQTAFGTKALFTSLPSVCRGSKQKQDGSIASFLFPQKRFPIMSFTAVFFVDMASTRRSDRLGIAHYALLHFRMGKMERCNEFHEEWKNDFFTIYIYECVCERERERERGGGRAKCLINDMIVNLLFPSNSHVLFEVTKSRHVVYVKKPQKAQSPKPK